MDPELRLFISVIAGLLVGGMLMACKDAWHQTFDPNPCICGDNKQDHIELISEMGRLPHGGYCRRCSCRLYIQK